MIITIIAVIIVVASPAAVLPPPALPPPHHRHCHRYYHIETPLVKGHATIVYLVIEIQFYSVASHSMMSAHSLWHLPMEFVHCYGAIHVTC